MYKTELVEEIFITNVTDKIDTKIAEMEKENYQFVTMSFLGTQRAVLVFKKDKK